MENKRWHFGAIKGRQFGYELNPEDYKKGRYFVAYYWFVGWWTPINIGFHLDFHSPNIEIHLPFGFIRIGWAKEV